MKFWSLELIETEQYRNSLIREYSWCHMVLNTYITKANPEGIANACRKGLLLTFSSKSMPLFMINAWMLRRFRDIANRADNATAEAVSCIAASEDILFPISYFIYFALRRSTWIVGAMYSPTGNSQCHCLNVCSKVQVGHLCAGWLKKKSRSPEKSRKSPRNFLFPPGRRSYYYGFITSFNPLIWATNENL